MSLESDILNDLQQLIQEHGVQARWNGINLFVLVSRNRNEQQLDIGGFVGSPDLSRVFLSSHFLQPCRNSENAWILMVSSIALRRISPQNVAPAREHFF